MSSQQGIKILIAGGASDSHTWNLVYLQLLLQEAGHRVVNAGPCVSSDLLVEACHTHTPDLVAVCSVNGHGHRDGLEAIGALRADPLLAAVPVVIGGKLGVHGRLEENAVALLREAGFTEVFADGDTDAFLALVAAHAAGSPRIRSAQSVR